MFKRLLFIGVLCLSLIALAGPDATARCRVIGGALKCASPICAEALLGGVGNVDQNAVAVCAGLNVNTVEGECVNQPLNSPNAQGTPFYPDLNIVSYGALSSVILEGDRGQALAKLCWDWENDIEGPVQDWIDENIDCDTSSEGPEYEDYCYGAGICVNPNWWFVQEGWEVSAMYFYFSSYQENKQGNMYSTSSFCKSCEGYYNEQDQTCGFSCEDTNPSNCASLAAECLVDVNNL